MYSIDIFGTKFFKKIAECPRRHLKHFFPISFDFLIPMKKLATAISKEMFAISGSLNSKVNAVTYLLLDSTTDTTHLICSRHELQKQFRLKSVRLGQYILSGTSFKYKCSTDSVSDSNWNEVGNQDFCFITFTITQWNLLWRFDLKKN